MSYIKKPNIALSNAPKNELGMTYTDYEGAMSTLCAGCGHDSITGAIIQTVFDLNNRQLLLDQDSNYDCLIKFQAVL